MLGKYFPPVPGGMEEYVKGLAALAAVHTDLTVLVHAKGTRSSRDRHDGYTLIRRATWVTLGSQPISPGMALDLLRQRFDLIHLHVPNVFAVTLVLLLRRGARLVVTHHADMVGFGLAGRLAVALYRQLLRRTRVVTVLSLKHRGLARDMQGVAVDFAALPVALDAGRYAATDAIKARAGEFRRAHRDASALFVFVGRLVPYKGLDVLIAAMARAPGLHCLVIGDGPRRAALEAQAEATGLAGRLAFLGPVDEAEKLAALHAADAFVLPSITVAEAFGIAQVEAQLCGLPVVTTDLPSGVTEVTRDGETGLVVPPGDPEALAAAMSRLAGDAALRARLGAAGQAHALATYTPDAVRSALLEIYARALDGHDAVMAPGR